MPANRTVDGVDFYLPGGVNERVLPELIPKEDFSGLVGLIPKQIGEILTAPGKSILTRVLQGQTILSFSTFGDFVLVQTNTNLIRFTNFELFGGIDFTNDLTPDVYTTTTSDEESMAQIILKYTEPSGNNGINLVNNAWTKVPFNTEVRDTGGNCVLIAGGAFTLSAGAYPKNCRIKAWTLIRGNGSGGGGPSMGRNGLFIPAISTTVPVAGLTGTNIRLNTAVAQAPASRISGLSILEDFFVLNAATTYDMRVFINDSQCTLGDQIGVGGLEERYAQVEILIE